MATRRVRRRPASDQLEQEVGDYLIHRSTRERSAYHEDKYKRKFMDLLAEAGELQDGGHRFLLLNEPILFHAYKSGKVTEKSITGIQRQRRNGSRTLAEERTLTYLKKRGLLQRCTTTVTVIDEDALLAANFDETISDEDLASLYDQGDDTYAFYLMEGEPVEDEE